MSSRLDRLIAETEWKIAEQAARIATGHDAGSRADSARRLLTGLRLDLATFRTSRDAIAEAHRLIG